MDVSYSKRFSLYLLFSSLIHLLLLYVLNNLIYTSYSLGKLDDQNLVVELIEIERTDVPKKLVEVSTPTDEIPETTDNIAEQNSVATAPVVVDAGNARGPIVDEVSEFDTIGGASEKFQKSTVSSSSVRREDQRNGKHKEKDSDKRLKVAKNVNKREEKSVTSESLREVELSDRVNADLTNRDANQEDQNNITDSEIANPGENPDIAMVSPKNTSIGKTQGRVYNEVKREGVLGFEALQDQIAPYLRNIQKKVERYWLHFLLTKYSGTKPTEVVIDCEIDENGNLVRVEVLGTAEDLFYASICKLALESASPFPPFPFRVPDIYQKRTLQIRWTFSFM